MAMAIPFHRKVAGASEHGLVHGRLASSGPSREARAQAG